MRPRSWLSRPAPDRSRPPSGGAGGRRRPRPAAQRPRLRRASPLLRRLLGAQALAFVFFAVVIPIEVVFAKETLDAGDAGYGALLASWGVGMVSAAWPSPGWRAAARRPSWRPRRWPSVPLTWAWASPPGSCWPAPPRRSAASATGSSGSP